MKKNQKNQKTQKTQKTQKRKYSKHWDSGYTAIPNNFGNEINSLATRWIWLKVASFNYVDKKQLSVRYVSKISGCSISSSAKALKELEELGYIEQVEKYDAIKETQSIYKIRLKLCYNLDDVLSGSTPLTEGPEAVEPEAVEPEAVEPEAVEPEANEGVLKKERGGVLKKERGCTKSDTKEITIKRNNNKEEEEEEEEEGKSSSYNFRSNSSELMHNFINAYNEKVKETALPKFKRLTAENWDTVLNNTNKLDMTLEEFNKYLDKVIATPFLRGDKTSFKAYFTWLIQKQNADKVLAGNYDEFVTKKDHKKETIEKLFNEIMQGIRRGGKTAVGELHKYLSPLAQKIVKNKWCKLCYMTEFDCKRELKKLITANV